MRDEQRHQHIHVEEIRQNASCSSPPCSSRSTFLTVRIWCTRAWSQGRHTSVEPGIGFRDPPQQRFHEVIDFLARLAGQIFEAFLEPRVEDNRGG
jgi:hypothetical protein